MGPGYEVDVIPLVEHGNDVPAEQVAGSPGAEAPAIDLLRIGPEQIAHGAVVGDLLLPVDDPDLIQGVDAGT